MCCWSEPCSRYSKQNMVDSISAVWEYDVIFLICWYVQLEDCTDRKLQIDWFHVLCVCSVNANRLMCTSFFNSLIFLFFVFLSISYWLCYYSYPNFSPFPLLHSVPLPSSNPPLRSYAWVLHISSLTSPFLILLSLFF